MFEGLVNLLPILKDLVHTSPNVELLEKKNKSNKNENRALGVSPG
jgi:hypothetical protein